MPIVKAVPGFVAYYVVFGEDDTITTVTIYRDKAGAEEANRRLLPWIRENLGQYLLVPPAGMAGTVVVHATP